MIQQLPIRGRRPRRRKRRPSQPLTAAFAQPAAAATLAYPGYAEHREEDARRTLATGLLAALLHAGGFALLLLVAGLAPTLDERVIPVRILPPEPPAAEEPAPAPRILAERRALPFDPAAQAVTPEIVSPRVVAPGAATVRAEALEMDSLETARAPAETHRSLAVERVSAVSSTGRARAAPIAAEGAEGPVVRGPTRAEAPARPSAGPRRVVAAEAGTALGAAAAPGGRGSSVKEGVLSDRDVVGSPQGAVLLAIDPSVGEGLRGGSAPGGSGTARTEPDESPRRCEERPEVQAYLEVVHDRTYARWVLPPGIEAGRRVTLRFRLDAAGSATNIQVVAAEDNALGASAVDALRAAAPFPPMPEPARCLARVPITGTFSNPLGG